MGVGIIILNHLLAFFGICLDCCKQLACQVAPFVVLNGKRNCKTKNQIAEWKVE
jgi:hypothetical protein